MTFGIFIALVTAIWLSSCGASALALYWNINAGPKRWRPACILSIVGLLIGLLGWSQIQLHASKTINGTVVWSLNSKWFFLGAILLGGCSLAVALWRWKKSAARGGPPPVP